MNRALPPILAIAAGLAVAGAVAFVPAWRLESAVSASGLPAFLSIAAPPLGWTARLGLMLVAALVVALPLWIGLTLLAGGGRTALPSMAEVEEDIAPSVRRADAHPDAPPRPPVRAGRDLGNPFLDPLEPAEPEITLPRDLDTPMAMFDPMALPAVPAAPPPTVRPLFRPAAVASEPVTDEIPRDGEAEPVAELPPVAPPSVAPSPAAPPAPSAAPPPSIDILLERLDRGLQRRRTLDRTPADGTPATGLASTLGALRRMAGGE